MRILCCYRLYSGFETGLARGVWSPAGTPAIYRMMEALARSPAGEVRFLLTARGAGWRETRDRSLLPDGFPRPLLILADNIGRSGFWRLFPTPARQIIALLREYLTFRPDLVCVDRLNVVAGALLARFFRARVLVRVLGVAPYMVEMMAGGGVRARLLRWIWSSPFAMVLCTMDGSGGGSWMERVLAPGVRREVWLNGVDPPAHAPDRALPELASLPRQGMIVLFLGRLEDLKRPDVFVEAMITLRRRHGQRIHALLVGSGAMEETLRQRIRDCGLADGFTLLPAVPHAHVFALHRRAHVYVSLNLQGNLSNANLEAYTSGMCVVLPPSSPDTDQDTDRLFPPDTALRLRPGDLTESLADALEGLLADPEGRTLRAEKTARRARETIRSWPERIERELGLYQQLVAGETKP